MTLRTTHIKEEENFKYLRTMLSKYLSLKTYIKDTSDKLKGAFFSLVNSGIIHENGLPSLSCQKFTNVSYCPKLCIAAKTRIL